MSIVDYINYLMTQNFEVKDSLGYWVARSARLLNKYFEIQIAEFRITRTGYSLLNCIDKLNNPSPSSIADYLKLDRGYVTRYLDKLERQKLIIRTHKKDDRRCVNLKLSTQGHKILPKLMRGSVETNKRIEEILTEAEMKSLRKILIKIGTSEVFEA